MPGEPRLSERERTVLLSAAEGMTDKEIARDLGLSLKTVGTYWDRMRRKFSASSRTQVLAQFLKMQAFHEHEVEGLARIFANFSDGVWVLGRGGQTLYVNPRAAELLKRGHHELASSHPIEVVGVGNHRKLKRLISSAKVEPASTQLSVDLGERKRWLEWRASTLLDGSGKPGPVLLLVSDGSDSRTRESALASLAAAMDLFSEHSSDAVVEFDQDGRVVSCCEWLREWASSQDRAILGHAVEDLPNVFLPVERWRRYIDRALATGGPVRFECNLVRPRIRLSTYMIRVCLPEEGNYRVLSLSRTQGLARHLQGRF